MSQELKDKLFRGGVWALGGKIVSIICAFVLNVVLTRALTPAEYGAYFVAFNTVIILATVATLGVDQVAVRFTAIRAAADDIEGVRAIIARSLGIVSFGTLAICLAFYFLAPWFFTHVVKAPAVAALSGLMIIWIVVASFQRQLAEIFRGLKDIRGATLFGGIRNNGMIISIMSSLAAAVAYGFDVLSLEAAYLIMSSCSLLVVVVSARTLWRRTHLVSSYQKEPVSESEAVNGSNYSLAAILAEGWPLWFAAIFGALRMQGDGWLAAAFDTPENVALYGAAQRFVGLVMAPLAIVNALLPPFVAEMHARGQLKQLERVIRGVAGLAGVPAIIILVIMIFVGAPLMGILFGDYYFSSYQILIILSIGQLVNVLTGSCFVVLAMTGHKRQVVAITIASSLMLITGGVLGGYYGGVFGVALVSFLSLSFHNLLGMMAVKKSVGIWTFSYFESRMMSEAFQMVLKKTKTKAKAKAKAIEL